MSIVKAVNKVISNTFELTLDFDNGWCSTEEFPQILKKERNRSDRTGSPISYVTLDFSNYYQNISYVDYNRLLKNVMLLISSNTREYDVKYFPNVSRIGLLLIDADLKGAKIVIERIYRKLYEYFKTQKKEDYTELIESISTTALPINHKFDSSQIQNMSSVQTDVNLKQENGKQETLQLYKERSNTTMNWNIKYSPNGTISLAGPILWENGYDQIRIFTYSTLKRVFDIISSILLIFLFSPVMTLISIVVKASSKGPVLFKQERLGYLGKSFCFLKFRTMRTDCDDSIHKDYVSSYIKNQNNEINNGSLGDPLFKLINDPRVTPFGRFLRGTSLDELPQLFNVLKGDMSLIGPRPPITYEVEEYQNWHLRRLTQVKPGITGLWQVSGRNKTTFDEMVRYDIQYAESMSFLLDMKILFKTVKAVLACEGT